MTTRQLPPELLSEIFSNLSSSPSTLYRSLLVSRTFCSLVKPFLYSHIMITSNEDCKLLHRIKEEDKQLVKKVSILGSGPYDVESYHPYREDYDEELCGLLGRCVRNLLAGNLLEISVIETLVIRNVSESPDSSFAPRVFKIASSLKELSIWDHQGGADIWPSYFLQHTNLPNLRRLGFVGVTSYNEKEDDSDFDDEYPSDEDGFGIYEVSLALPFSSLYTQLEVLVARPPSRLEDYKNFPFNNFLAFLLPSVLVSPFPLSRLVRNCGTTMCSAGMMSRTIETVKNLRPKSNNPDNLLHFFFLGPPSKSNVSRKNQETISQIQTVDIIVHEEGYDDDEPEESLNSLIFTSFVNYLNENARML